MVPEVRAIEPRTLRRVSAGAVGVAPHSPWTGRATAAHPFSQATPTGRRAPATPSPKT
jgi:hypothetical protein